MASEEAAAPARRAAFELKGTVASLTVIRLLVPELARVDAQLGTQVAQLPRFFEQAPVIVDLEALGEAAGRVELSELAALLRHHRLVPVAIRHLAAEREAEAARAGLGLLRGPAARGGSGPLEAPTPSAEASAPASAAPERLRAAATDQRRNASERGTTTPNAPEPAPLEPPPPAPAAATEALGSLLLTQPARSGQVIYAAHRDLVLLAPVNAGAELISDGHIHVYGALRGRALAGAHGNEAARIFCSSLEAELVSIAGEYLSADRLPERFRGKPTQIHLQGGELVFRPL